MNKLLGTVTAALWLAAWTVVTHGAEPATVKEDRANVRGKASLSGEVITQLKAGETVLVLDEITVEKPKADEPAKWAKIQMPTNTPVWVFASFVNPDTKAVTARKLNIRAGPGENFSSIGILEKDTVLQEIRVADGWMEIETPTNAFGFVAAELLEKAAAPAAPAATVAKDTPATAQPPPAQPAQTPVVVPPPDPTVVQVPTPDETVTTAKPATVEPPPVTPQQPVTTPPVTKPVATAPVTLPPPAPLVTTPPANEPPPKRIVAREGLVRGTKSIQAPTDFQLVSPETGEPINYLLTDKIDIKLEPFKGRKVLVTGEELMDKRWPKTPLIRVETLRIVP